jgi:hypothetical protein
MKKTEQSFRFLQGYQVSQHRHNRTSQRNGERKRIWGEMPETSKFYIINESTYSESSINFK